MLGVLEQTVDVKKVSYMVADSRCEEGELYGSRQ